MSSISLCFSVWIRGLTDILFFVPVVLRRSQQKFKSRKHSTLISDHLLSQLVDVRGPDIVWLSSWGLYRNPGSPEFRWAVGGRGQQSLAQGLIYKPVTAPGTGGHSALVITVGDSGTSRVCNQRNGGSWYHPQAAPTVGLTRLIGVFCSRHEVVLESAVKAG